jgi:hypothetical protein
VDARDAENIAEYESIRAQMAEAKRAQAVVPLRAAGADFAFVHDASALVVVEQVEPGPIPLVRVVALLEVRNDDGPRDPVEVITRFARLARDSGCGEIMADTHYRELVVRILANEGIGHTAAPVTQDQIAASFFRLRNLVHARRIIMPNNARLKRQLKFVTTKPTGQGISIDQKREPGSHGDIVSALVCALWQLGNHIALGEGRITWPLGSWQGEGDTLKPQPRGGGW